MTNQNDPTSLNAAKDHVARLFLGKAGIHAIGVHEDAAAITVHTCGHEESGDQVAALEAIRKIAAPFPVQVYRSERGVASAGDNS